MRHERSTVGGPGGCRSIPSCAARRLVWLAVIIGSSATNLSAQPVITAAVNAASYAPNASLAPGVIFSIFGSSLTDGTTASASNAVLPTQLAGATVLVNGAAAPIFFASPKQINSQFPVELTYLSQATIQVRIQTAGSTISSPALSVPVASVSPAIFTLDQNGSGPAAIEHSTDFSLVCPQGRSDCAPSPAFPGETVVVYGVGLGPVRGTQVSGQPVSTASPTLSTPTVAIGGIQAQVLFTGLVTQFVGVYQLNVKVPATVPFGNAAITVAISGVVSNAATIAIGPQVIQQSQLGKGGGPPGGTVTAIQPDPLNPLNVYAIVSGKAYKSINGGQTWSGPIFVGATCVSVDPKNSGGVYVGVNSNINTNYFSGNSGVYRSIDSGQTWTSISSGISDPSVNSLAVDPATPSTLYAGTSSGVFKSVDSGRTWTATGTSIPVSTLAIDPEHSLTVFAGTSTGLLRTVDGGQNWATANTGITSFGEYVNSIAIDPKNSNNVYVGIERSGAFKSTDGGQSWAAIGQQYGFYFDINIAIDPNVSSTIYVAENSAVMKSADRGQTWTGIGTLPMFPAEPTSIAVDPTTSGTLYVGFYAAGIYKTVGGQNWIASNSGLSGQGIAVLTINRAKPSSVFAGSYGGGLFSSQDGGHSWSSVSPPSWNVESLALDPLNPNSFYSGTQHGLYKTTDGGRSWSNLSSLPGDGNVYSVAIDPSNNTVVYAGNSTGIFKSADAGQSWISIGPVVVGGIVIDPTNSFIVYGALHGGVYKTTNGGQNWTILSSGLPDLAVRCLAVDPHTPSVIYAGLVSGLAKSSDGGQTWAGVALPYADGIVSVAIDPSNTQNVYAAGGAVFKSADGGRTWAAIDSGLPISNAGATTIIVDPANTTTIYVGTGVVGGGMGVFKSVDGGATWQPTSAN